MNKIGYVVSAVFIVLGIAGVIIGVVKWEDKSKKQIKGRFGIIIDAGGSGTRLSVFEYKKDDSLVEVDYIECEDKGIAKYVSNLGVLKDLLTKCLNKAEKDIPKKVLSSVPVNMEATAGMRILKLMNESAYNKIWNGARDALSKSHFNFRKAGTIKGSEEAVYAWTSVNYLKNGFKSNKLTGALEMGSSSLQVSFIPAKKDFNSENTTVTINGKHYTVYVHSYLCYGRSQFERRYLAKLVMDSGYSKTVNDPCAYKGRQIKRKSEYLWAVPCCSGSYALKTFGSELKGPANQVYTFQGQSNFSQCQERVKGLLNTSHCTHPSCSIDGVSQPPPFGDFVGLSTFYYTAKFLNLSTNVKRSGYEAASKRICSMTAAEVGEIPGSAKYKYSYCLSSVFGLSFLTKGVHFNDSNWKIQFTQKINGKSIAWTQGSQLMKKDEMSLPIFQIKRPLTKTEFILILTFCSVAILAGVIITVFLYRRRAQ